MFFESDAFFKDQNWKFEDQKMTTFVCWTSLDRSLPPNLVVAC